MPDEGTATAEVVATEVTPAPSGDEPVVTPEATPATPAAEEAVATQDDAPEGPLSRGEARRRMQKERAAKRAAQEAEAAKAARAAAETPAATPEAAEVVAEEEPAAPVIDDKGRAHDPKSGEFLPKTGETDAPPVDTQEAVQAAEPAGTEPKPDPLRILIAEDHPLRKMGPVTEITAANPEEAAVIRAAFNSTGVRRKELERAKARIVELEATGREQQQELLRRESGDTAETQWKETPEYAAHVEKYQNIYDAVGQEEASGYWQGAALADFQKFRDAEFSKRSAEVEHKAKEEASQKWFDEAWESVSGLPDILRKLPNFRQMFTETAETLSARLEMGHFPEIDTSELVHAEFTKQFMRRLQRDPAVKKMRERALASRGRKEGVDAVRDERAKEAQEARETQAGKTAVDQLKRDAAERRADAPPHPMGSIPSVPRTGEEATAPVEVDETAGMTPTQARKYHKAAAREDARRRAGRM